MFIWRRWEKALALALFLTVAVAVVECRIGAEAQQELARKMVRLHVLANSDSEYDQHRKLLVKDAIVARTEEILRSAENQNDAEQRLENVLPELELLAEETLRCDGREEDVSVALADERFNTRYYDGFTLPAGQYRSLQVVIGAGAGRNWWCVVFPSLCLPVSGEGFETEAVSAGFSETLTNTIRHNGEYRLRFFLLDCIGKLENIFVFG